MTGITVTFLILLPETPKGPPLFVSLLILKISSVMGVLMQGDVESRKYIIIYYIPNHRNSHYELCPKPFFTIMACL